MNEATGSGVLEQAAALAAGPPNEARIGMLVILCGRIVLLGLWATVGMVAHGLAVLFLAGPILASGLAVDARLALALLHVASCISSMQMHDNVMRQFRGPDENGPVAHGHSWLQQVNWHKIAIIVALPIAAASGDALSLALFGTDAAIALITV